jgi:hypothetical protein
MIVKIYREMDKNKKTRGERGLTLIRILEGLIQKGKEMVRTM